MVEQVIRPARRLSREIVQLMLEMNSQLRQRGITVALTAADACDQLIQQSASFEEAEIVAARRRLIAVVTDVPEVETSSSVQPKLPPRSLSAKMETIQEANVKQPPAEPLNIFLRDPENAQLTCDQCQTALVLDPNQVTADAPPLEVTCACGAMMHVDSDGRKYPRYATNLPGQYTHSTSGKTGALVVKDMSFGGLRFITSALNQIADGDRLEIQFTLDDEAKSLISEPIDVRYVNQKTIGAEFANGENFDKRLVRYLFR